MRNGIGAADPILIDTKKNVVVGRGGFSFKNESLDFAVRAATPVDLLSMERADFMALATHGPFFKERLDALMAERLAEPAPAPASVEPSQGG